MCASGPTAAIERVGRRNHLLQRATSSSTYRWIKQSKHGSTTILPRVAAPQIVLVLLLHNAHAENNLAMQQGGPEPSLRLHHVTKQNAHAENSNATKSCGHHEVTNQDKTKAVLYSMNSRNKDKPMAKGTLVSKRENICDWRNMLGVQYVAVLVHCYTYLGDDRLVRPYEKFQTVREAIGSVIAWPHSHVKIVKPTTPAQPQNIGRRGLEKGVH